MKDEILIDLKKEFAKVYHGSELKDIEAILEKVLNIPDNLMYNYITLNQLRLAFQKCFEIEVKKNCHKKNRKEAAVKQVFCQIAYDN
jgi:hypothetical protein